MKTLISSTAIAMLIASGAIAQTETTTETDTDAEMTETEDGETVQEIEPVEPEGEAAAEGELTVEDEEMSDTDAMTDDGAMAEEETMTDDGAMAEEDTTMTDDGAMVEEDSTMTDDGAMTDDGTMMDDDGMATGGTVADDGAMMDDGTMTDEAGMISPMEGYAEMSSEGATVEQIQGAAVYGGDMNELGNINDFVVTAEGQITDVIIDVGGFLGIGEKPVALAFDTVTLMQQVDGEDIRVFVQETEEQLEAMEEYEGDM
ncbi:hypothetical protein EU805_04120 [Salipiger sp. IMCC34102]|uniref:PRC-barrel domain-containing protein n=1 Tax=Salipiger sp. IMCC34102 TaxID=2510647 RepID=UPI00101D77FD|nr:PRC-barrel domain-containing protein [Salipiger sp. IMCC34102]RYH04551.1 hypothetical protein EU805_04120 [Salipiger sp. IMCC34102]